MGNLITSSQVNLTIPGRLIDRVLKDSSYSARAKVMSERLVKLEHESPRVAVIEEALAQCLIKVI